ncbi:MAG: MATE family efflux transporter [Oscillospiraceae bacterium]|nr:MATE family efflux transporter [Oscillospiraceae bacterium]
MAAIRAKKADSSLLEGPIFMRVLRFALPLIVTNLLQALYTAADMMIVGLSGVEGAIGSIGTCNAMLALLVAVFIGFSVGADVVVARNIGARDRGGTVRAMHTSVVVGAVFGIAAAVVGEFACRPILVALGNQGYILDLATVYARIYIAGAPAMCLTNYAAAVYRAKGDSQTPMCVLSIAGVCNVLLNLLFVLAFGMSVDGVALATLLSNVISAVWLLWGLMREDGWCRLVPRKLGISRTEFWQIIRIGIPAGIQRGLFSLANLVVQSSVVTMNNELYPGGSAVLDAHAAGASLEHIPWVIEDGVNQASVTFVSQHVGAQKYDRLKRVIAVLYLVTFLVAEGSALLFILFRHPLVSLYVQGEAAELAAARLVITLSCYFTLGFMDTGSGILRGLGKSLTSTIIALLGSCALRVVWLMTVFRIPEYHTLDTIYVAYPISWSVASIAMFTAIVINMRKLRKQIKGY